ncbi:19243_t:CDS:2 [Dentiscutata erythropus]|uniref:19243_t:CDS:1 n=1 Tax=Dentiscutata erythropus TaxID=1348616 RepID=A0A9N8ZBE9_9GLOM|nr:19243_t:CDS:2 [Dentiscutata erythropus]
MIRRNPTRLEIRQENVEQLQLLRQEYKKKLSQKPGAMEHQEPIVGAEELRNRRKNM